MLHKHCHSCAVPTVVTFDTKSHADADDDVDDVGKLSPSCIVG